MYTVYRRTTESLPAGNVEEADSGCTFASIYSDDRELTGYGAWAVQPRTVAVRTRVVSPLVAFRDCPVHQVRRGEEQKYCWTTIDQQDFLKFPCGPTQPTNISGLISDLAKEPKCGGDNPAKMIRAPPSSIHARPLFLLGNGRRCTN